MVEIVIFKGSYFHRWAARGLLELRCSKSLYWTCSTHLWVEGLSEAVPSLARRQFLMQQVCRLRSRGAQLAEPGRGSCSPLCPFPTFQFSWF